MGNETPQRPSRRSTGTGHAMILIVAAATQAAACAGEDDPGDVDAAIDLPWTGGDAGGGTSAGDIGVTDLDPRDWFTFAPSNIALEQLRLGDVSNLGEAVLDSDKCEIEVRGESGAIRCWSDPHTIATVPGHKYLKVRVVGGPLLDVFVARSWTITARTTLPASGLVVLVALEEIVIEGMIDLTGRASGTEPGVGPMSDSHMGPGGGGFCGHGGAGAYSSLGTSMVYGTADLMPPRVGSAGGPGAMQSGAGGGFLHLVAGRSIRVAAGGKVNAGGSKGQYRGGGGSGGAILIEAPQVTIAGAVAANGGGGGGDMPGEDATASDIPAAGGRGPLGEPAGGLGSAAASVDGGDAASVSVSVTSGGGGGAGRIRLNAGETRVTGVISPALGTPCVTQGSLRPS